MSKAEELANFLEFHFTEYERCHPNDAPMCESAAAELRRLAQVEAEHAALLKAISDAEPVAWRLHPFDYGVGHEGAYAVTQFPQQLAAWEKKGWAANPLYTLNGIKKP